MFGLTYFLVVWIDSSDFLMYEDSFFCVAFVMRKRFFYSIYLFIFKTTNSPKHHHYSSLNFLALFCCKKSTSLGL